MVDELDEELSELEGAYPQRGASKGKILLLLLPIILVVGSISGLYFSGIADKLVEGGEKKVEEEIKKEGSVFYDLPELFVNLSVQKGQKPIYFKIRVTLEMASAQDAEQAELMLPRVIDSLQFYLREMRLDEIQGSIGTYRLKEEIQSRLNRILVPAKVNDVLFKEILIQ